MMGLLPGECSMQYVLAKCGYGGSIRVMQKQHTKLNQFCCLSGGVAQSTQLDTNTMQKSFRAPKPHFGNGRKSREMQGTT